MAVWGVVRGKRKKEEKKKGFWKKGGNRKERSKYWSCVVGEEAGVEEQERKGGLEEREKKGMGEGLKE